MIAQQKILIRVTAKEKELIKMAAIKDNRSVNQWIRVTLAKAVK